MNTTSLRLVSTLTFVALLAGSSAAQSADPAGGAITPRTQRAAPATTPPVSSAADPAAGVTGSSAVPLGGTTQTYSVGTNALDFVPGSGSCGVNQAQSIGWQFDVTSPITATAMSWFDDGQNGLDVAHEVGIWDPSGTLIGSTHVTIPAGTAATLDGIWRIVSIPPTPLAVGSGYIVGGFNGAHGECLSFNVTQTPNSDINYVDATFSGLNGIFERPDNFSGATNGFYGCGFQLGESAEKKNAMDFTPGSGSCGVNQGQSIGWQFDVTSPVTVTSMSWFDDGQDGLDLAHEVGIWDPSGTLIGSTHVTIPAGTAATLDGIWRTVSIPPTPLAIGSGYIVGGFNGSHGECLSFNVTQSPHPDINYVDATFSGLNGIFERPDNFSAAINGFYGCGFQIEVGGPTAYCDPGNPNSVSAGGAVLTSTGGYGTAGATFNISDTPDQPSILYSGPNAISTPFGCGVRCVGGSVVRGPVVVPSGNSVNTSFDMSAPGLDNIQWWYRDPANFGVCGSSFNLSNALMP